VQKIIDLATGGDRSKEDKVRPQSRYCGNHLNVCPSFLLVIVGGFYLVNSLQVVVLLGAALPKGGFKVKRHLKGPTAKLRDKLALRVPVILVDEFRSSKCCVYCGAEVKHAPAVKRKRARKHKHPVSAAASSSSAAKPAPSARKTTCAGVSFCDGDNKKHRAMVNRDTDACFKIFYLFVARGLGYGLGAFLRPDNDGRFPPSLQLREHRQEAKDNDHVIGKRMQDLFKRQRIAVKGNAKPHARLIEKPYKTFHLAEQGHSAEADSTKIKLNVHRGVFQFKRLKRKRRTVWRPISRI
jgi:hypothetical protein